jgi:uncharacterized membrane protein YphA (DoxX/SURF4 family)
MDRVARHSVHFDRDVITHPRWKVPMNVALWIMAGILAVAFLASGFMKVSRTKEQLQPMMGWVANVPSAGVKALGALEILGALGLILPPLFGIAQILVPIAATGLAIVMVGAIIVHARRKEAQPLPVNVLLLILAVIVAWGRFGPHKFG